MDVSSNDGSMFPWNLDCRTSRFTGRDILLGEPPCAGSVRSPSPSPHGFGVCKKVNVLDLITFLQPNSVGSIIARIEIPNCVAGARNKGSREPPFAASDYSVCPAIRELGVSGRVKVDIVTGLQTNAIWTIRGTIEHRNCVAGARCVRHRLKQLSVVSI